MPSHVGRRHQSPLTGRPARTSPAYAVTASRDRRLGVDEAREQPHPAVEPGPAAEAADHRDRHRRDHLGPDIGPGVAEVEQRRAGLLQPLRLLDRIAAPRRAGEHRDAPPRRAPRAARAVDLDDVGAGLAAAAAPRRRDGVGQVAAHERALDAARAPPASASASSSSVTSPSRLAAPEVDADAVADRDDVDAGPVDAAAPSGVPGDDADDLPPLALHRSERGERSSFTRAARVSTAATSSSSSVTSRFRAYGRSAAVAAADLVPVAEDQAGGHDPALGSTRARSSRPRRRRRPRWRS